jgi:hypothetical protein
MEAHQQRIGDLTPSTSSTPRRPDDDDDDYDPLDDTRKISIICN